MALSLLLTAGAGTASGGTYKLTEEEKKVVSLSGQQKVYVKNSRGKTIIVGKKDARDMTIRAKKFVRDRDAESAAGAMEKLVFEVTAGDDEVAITTRHPDGDRRSRSFWSFLREIQYQAYIDYTIELPSRFDAKVSSASGEVEITSLDGRADVFGSSGEVILKDLGGSVYSELSSGDLDAAGIRGDVWVRLSSGEAKVRDVGGNLTVEATSGDVDVGAIGGDATVEVVSGDLSIKGCRGNVVAKTSSGDGRIEGVEGNITARASSGDLRITISPVGAKTYDVKTASGDVSITYLTPNTYGFTLNVSTASGSIEGDLDITLDKISRRMLRGRVGSGESTLSVETASGDVTIKQGALGKGK